MLYITSTKTSLTILVFIVSMTPVACLGVVHGDVELLRTVALRHKANLEAILTWKGEAFEERASTRGDWYDFMIKNKCIFAYDQLKDSVRWNKEPQESRCINRGEPQTIIHSNYNSAMFKDQAYYEYSGWKQPDKDKVVHHLAIDEPSVARGWQGHSLSPRYLLSLPGGANIHDKLLFLYKNANNEKGFEWYVKRDGNLVTLQVTPDETRTSKEVYDLSAGGNLVEYYNKKPRGEITQKYTYEEKSGVWVLKSFEKMTSRRNNGEVHKSTRIINWTNSVVNVPFEEDEFTMEKLGVKHGDLVSDHRIGMAYVYGGFLRDSEMLGVLYTNDMPGSTIATKNDMVSEDTNNVVPPEQQQDSNEVGATPQTTILSETTPAVRHAEGARKYTYVIATVIVIGLAAIVYMLANRFRKEDDQRLGN